jgi:alkylated DNA repair protein alkB family protein 1
MQHLDPHERPPDGIRNVYKKYQKMKLQHLENDRHIVYLTRRMDTLPDKVRIVRELNAEDLSEAFRGFAGSNEPQHQGTTSSIAVYEHEDMPGNTLLTLMCR